MTHRSRVAAAISALLASLTLATPATASQSSERRIIGEHTACVIPHEFNHLYEGEPRAEVQEWLDGPGVRSTVKTHPGLLQREYRICGTSWRYGVVVVRYRTATDRMVAAIWVSGGLDFGPHGGHQVTRPARWS